MVISPTHIIINEIQAGRMVVLVDEEDRENEGDLVLAADFVSAEAINFMAKYGRGLICLTLTEAKCQALELPMMVRANGSQYGTNFTLSIEAAEGVTTGISAADRALTIQKAVAPHAKPDDLVQPGHVFPLKAQNGGVLVRAGHTEAGCDLAQLAGLSPASVICEIMNDDGTMARLPDLQTFASIHDLKIGTIRDLIEYRSQHESLVQLISQRVFHTTHGEMIGLLFQDTPSQAHHLVLVRGQLHNGQIVNNNQPTMVRVHEPLSIVDVLETQTSTHSWTIEKTLAHFATLSDDTTGIMILLNCNQSASALAASFDQLVRIDANPHLQGQSPSQRHKQPSDLRTYGIGAQILRHLGVRHMSLMASPRKMPSMTGFGLEVIQFISPL